MGNQTELELNPDAPILIDNSDVSIYHNSQSFEHAQRIAKMITASNLIPAKYQNNIPNTMIALEMANRMKLSPLMVMQNLDVVQGKPSWSSTFVISMINGCGKFKDFDWEVVKDNTGATKSAFAYATRLSDNKRIEGTTVTLDMAVAEGWMGKNGSKWKTMPEQMIRYRSATFFARLHCPELLNGIVTTDEVYDIKSNDEYSQEQRQSSANAAKNAYNV